MRLYFKIKMAQLRLLSQKLHEKAKKLALAVVLMEYIIAGSWYIAEDRGWLSFLEPKTIIIYQAEAKEVDIDEAKKPETTKEIVARIAKENKFTDIELLNRIIECESGYDRYAKNTISSARGLFQILDMHGLSEVERYNPETSTKWAIDRIKARGTKDWNASKGCWDIK